MVGASRRAPAQPTLFFGAAHASAGPGNPGPKGQLNHAVGTGYVRIVHTCSGCYRAAPQPRRTLVDQLQY